MKTISCFALVLIFTVFSGNAQHDTIKSVDDIPRFTYQIDTLASAVYANEDQFRTLYLAVERNLRSLKDDYVIEDATLNKSILSILAYIDIFEQRYNKAKTKVEMIKSLEEKPASKQTSGLLTFSYLHAISRYKLPKSEEFRAAYKSELQKLIKPLDYNLVADNIKSSKSRMEIFSDNLIMGLIKENIDPASTEGELSGDFANSLIGFQFTSKYIMPFKQEAIEVFKAYLDANQIKKEDIWKTRHVNLTNHSNLSPVTIAIWDSGIDDALFPDNMYVNIKEKKDNLDNDGNGYIDDINGIAYDLNDNKTTGNLLALTDDEKVQVLETLQLHKGLIDLQNNIPSEQAEHLKKTMAELESAEVKPFIENLSLFGNYAHGTHVAGIAVADNPAAKLLVSRITFDHKIMPELPTVEKTKKHAAQVVETINYFKSSGVRVVNMSFGWSLQDVETALEMHGVGTDAEERKKLARDIFDISKTAFYNAIKEAQDILFITSAGNSNEDSEFYDAIPSSFNLPNILSVGAVDQSGEETSFTSFGDNVDVHANGFNVESYVPGGERLKMSGTSMSSPNVANLAGKIWAINPQLSVEDVKNYIVSYSDISEDGRIILMNPKASIDAVEKNMPSINGHKNTKIKG